jgi:hypothetical protein
MSNTTPSRVGQINSSGAVDALFLKVFSGEILTTFDETNVMKDLHTVRTISNGKSAQFPATGIAKAKYHTVGESIGGNGLESGSGYLSDIKKAEVTINIDDVLLSSVFLANIDELKTHYDVRSIYAQELGKALANRFDGAVMKTLIAGSRQLATITDGAAGVNFTGTGGMDSASEIITDLFTAAQKLDENDVPSDDRYAILTPSLYYKLLSDNSNNVILNRDFGGSADPSRVSVPQVAGFSIYKSNRLATIAAGGDDSAVATGDGASKNDVFDKNHTGENNGTGYNGDFSNVGIIGGHKAGVGTVKLLDLATESEYQIDRQGTLFVAKYAMGHGVIRPEACFSIKTA